MAFRISSFSCLPVSAWAAFDLGHGGTGTELADCRGLTLKERPCSKNYLMLRTVFSVLVRYLALHLVELNGQSFELWQACYMLCPNMKGSDCMSSSAFQIPNLDVPTQVQKIIKLLQFQLFECLLLMGVKDQVFSNFIYSCHCLHLSIFTFKFHLLDKIKSINSTVVLI